MNKPAYLGFSITELSKTLMNEFIECVIWMQKVLYYT